MTWTTVELEVVTPLFSGDDPSARTGTLVRVPSIRGALRYWFRAVAAGHGITDLTRLWTEEESVFGSTHKPSPIALRVSAQPGTPDRLPTPDWAVHHDRRKYHGAQYLLGQGLWTHGTGLTRPYLRPGRRFTLQVRFSGDQDTDARFMLALWAWLTYGGLGARTRRGFGQLRSLGVAGDLPPGWAAADLAQPSPAGWQALGGWALPAPLAERAPSSWPPLLASAPDMDEALPPIPSLTPRWWKGVLLPDTIVTLGEALDLAGRDWRTYRADTDPDAEPGRDMRSPEWTHVIHGDDQRYPVAALGLPVGYFSPAKEQRAKFSATVTPYHDGAPLRRASPVWIRPLRFQSGWRIFTHVFWCALLPAKSELRITGDRTRTVPVPDDHLLTDAWDNWAAHNYRLPPDFYP
jgi:CRISPR type III-B/RAMP module RAMP protein Cmr1